MDERLKIHSILPCIMADAVGYVVKLGALTGQFYSIALNKQSATRLLIPLLHLSKLPVQNIFHGEGSQIFLSPAWDVGVSRLEGKCFIEGDK